MQKGTIFDIQRFSLHDGPGVRTTVFMKGCPLRCVWCHNPEGLSPRPQIRYDSEKCMGCMECVSVCVCHKAEEYHVFYRDGCTNCGRCAEVCPTGALETVGREMTVGEVMEKVLADRKYYTDGGGMTLSGGEPTAQAEFARSLLAEAKKAGIGTAIETCGFAENDVFMSVASLCDLLLFDIKLTDEAEHVKYTGVSNEKILENLRTAGDAGIPVILRCPIIPGINDTKEHLDGIAELLNKAKSVFEIHIEPYHTLGLSKTASLGMAETFRREPMSVNDAENLCLKLKERVNIPVKVSK